jgi:hypothetical protein
VNSSIIVAIAIVVAAITLKLPLSDYARPVGHYQITAGAANAIFRIDTAAGDGWILSFSGPTWRPFADNGARP